MPHTPPSKPSRLNPVRIAAVLLGLAVIGLAACLLIWFLPGFLASQAASRVVSQGFDQDAPHGVKLAIPQEGIYRIRADELAALGWADAQLQDLELSHRGVAQPFWFEAEEILFYAGPPDSRYTAESVYLLERTDTKQALPAPRREAESASSAESIVQHHIHLEENHNYFPRANGVDNWFWMTLPAPQAVDFEVSIGDGTDGPGQIRLKLFASSDAAAIDPDHHLRVSINGEVVLDEFWDGQGWVELSAEIPASVLIAGENQITIEAPGDTGVAADINQLDWIEIDYPGRAEVRSGQLSFTSLAEAVRLTGFDQPPLVVRIADDATPAAWVTVQEGQQGWLIQTSPQSHYLAASQESLLRPTSIAAIRAEPDLRAADAQAEYIAIGPDDLLAALEPLLEFRREQGLQVLSIPSQAVFDQFNYGIAEPEAIRRYLQYAYQNWDSPPRFLLLVGDASHDPRGYKWPADLNILPAYNVNTQFGGETVSDVLFAMLDQDENPDLAVGRVPARTSQEVSIFVEKTLAYESSLETAGNDWRYRILAVADNSEASFEQDAAAFLEGFEAPYATELFAPESGSSDAGQAIAGFLDEGVLFLSYFGHGSLVQWGREGIFTVDQGAKLNNRRLPVMVNITCLAGLFTHPEVQSLAEIMLLNPEGGSVAALAATSLTTPPDQRRLTDALVEALSEHPQATLGEIVLMAQREISPLPHEGVREVLETFLLFGDPALRLGQPARSSSQ